MGGVERALQLLAIDPGLGGIITVGFQVDDVPGRRVPPHAALCGHQTPWGWQPGFLDEGGPLVANLDLLSPEAQAVLAQRLDGGGCTLVASCAEAPWAHLADRVAFLAVRSDTPWRASQRPLGLTAAVTQIAALATRYGVAGHRAEEFCLRTALAIARATGRQRLTEGDVAEAVALVLAPRATAVPPPCDASTPQPSEESATSEAAAPPLSVTPPPLPAQPVQVRQALHGARHRSVAARRRRGSLDLVATLLAALPWQRLRQASAPPLAIRPDDLRWHLLRPRVGRLIIFLVDSSGSMGARRLGQAKGAVLQWLQQAYRRRDRVALITAGGTTARLLLPPARAVEQARKALVTLPAGGGTPLAGAMLLAHRLAGEAGRREGRPALLIAQTDGRANQPLPGHSRTTVREELMRSAALLRQVVAESLLLGEPGPEIRDLSRWLGGALLPLHAHRSFSGKLGAERAGLQK